MCVIRRGMTLIELLVVIGIIMILGSLLFPVLGKAREKGRQSKCMSNQRQIATAIMMCTSDNSERYPRADLVWSQIDLSPKVFVCPSDSTLANGYVYNNELSDLVLAAVSDTSAKIMVGDGQHPGDPATANIAYGASDYQKRHDKRLIVCYADGHAKLVDNPE